jgi:hypothetical protein
MNLGIIVALFLAFWSKEFSDDFIFIYVLKMTTDARLIIDTSRYYRGRKKKIRDLGFACLIYPFFSVFVAIQALFSGYQWKGRRFRK